jgi:spore coat protein CotH
VTDAGHTIQVEIYRGPDTGWTLEVVDEFNNSRVWDDQFPTDREALDELLRTIREDGIQSLVG